MRREEDRHKKTLEEIVKDHLVDDNDFRGRMTKVLFGDADDKSDKGMVSKVDEMHAILTSTKSIIGFFGGVGGGLKWILIIGAVVGLFKGWWISLIAYVIK